MKKIIVVTALFLISLVFWWLAGRTSEQEAVVGYETSTTGVFALEVAGATSQALRGGFFDFLASPHVAVWEQIVFSGKRQTVALNDFLLAIGVKVETGLVSRLDQNRWYLYRCASVGDGGVGGGGVVLATRFSRPEDSLEIQRNLLAWEPTIVASVSQLLFPYDLYRADPVTVGGFVTASEYSYATLRIVPVQVDGYGRGEVGYLYFDQTLLIGGDGQCLREAEERLFEVQGG